MDQGAVEVAEAFLRRYPRYLTPATAASQCRIATIDLVDDLQAKRWAAHVVWVRQPPTPFPRAHPRALHSDEHALVALDGGGFIDVTRRQYDPDAAVPTVYAAETDLAADWLEINDDEDRNAPWRVILSKR